MKKSTLALSIAAAIGGLGLAGNALAVTNISGAASGSVIARNDNGIGHQLVFPYFTAQNDNVTLLSITNTDTTNGKLVKVRFRGAANSDDLYDFQVALSPGDVWTSSIALDGAGSGAAKLTTSDVSCTVPDNVRKPVDLVKDNVFSGLRTDGASVAQTLEGYVEVINMADIPKPATGATSVLFNAIKHVSGKAPCTASVLADALGADASVNTLTGFGLAAPTTGLTGDWIILNQKSTAAWSGSATALQVVTTSGGVATTTPTTGNLVFWPQISDAGPASPATYTADPLITSGVLSAKMYDYPDMSTPYAATTDGTTTIAAADAQADATTAALAVKSVANQYVTDASIAAVTDILLSQPTRRYSVAVNYKSSTIADANGNTLQVPLATNGTIATALYRGASQNPLTSTTLNNVTYKVAAATSNGSAIGGAGYNGLTAATALAAAVGTGSAYYGPSSATNAGKAKNLAFPTGSRILCLNTILKPSTNTIFDREESTPGGSTTTTTVSFVVSPNTSTSSTPNAVYVCGEAAVVSINDDSGKSALSSVLARTGFSADSVTAYNQGWVFFDTALTGNTSGLPIIGQSFIRATNVVNNAAVNYGFGYRNKVTR